MIEKMKFGRRGDSQTIKKPKDIAQANTSANMDSTPDSSGDWSDVVITCRTHTWRLHKEILMSRCDYFRDRCLAGQRSSQIGVRSFGLCRDGHVLI
jgi:hypothetical protein